LLTRREKRRGAEVGATIMTTRRRADRPQEPTIRHISELCNVVGRRAFETAEDAHRTAEALVSCPRHRSGSGPASGRAAAPGRTTTLASSSHGHRHRRVALTDVTERASNAANQIACTDHRRSIACSEYVGAKRLYDTCAEVKALADHVDDAHRAQVAVLRDEVATLRKASSQWKHVALRHHHSWHPSSSSSTPHAAAAWGTNSSSFGGASSFHLHDSSVGGNPYLVIDELRTQLQERDAMVAAQRLQIDFLTKELQRISSLPAPPLPGTSPSRRHHSPSSSPATRARTSPRRQQMH
jgi:hypothetical protein